MSVGYIEQALFVGRWNDQIDSNTVVAKYAKDVVEGSFHTVLTSADARAFFTVLPSWDIEKPIETWFEFTLPIQDELFQLVLGIACLHAFVQANWTGPDLDFTPLDFLTFPKSDEINEAALSQKATSELAYGGEPAYHLTRVPIVLRLADLLLAKCQARSAVWWRLRIWRVRQQTLDEPVALSAEILSSIIDSNLDDSLDADVKGRTILEQGVLDHTLSNDRSAAEHFVKASRATGLEYELTGALGKRTKFQQTDITQLVLLAQSRQTTNGEQVNGNEASLAASKMDASLPETLDLNDDTLLERTEFTSSQPTSDSKLSHLDPNSQPPLDPLDQCILLGLCLNVRNTSPAHGLTSEQMSPYVARVISHPRNWSVHTMALLLRSRLESNRTRTVERSTLQLQALVDQMPTADSSINERLLYFHSIPLPSKWELERELALRFLSIGVVKSALEIFERLEMWEEVVKCWQSMERQDKGIAIVRDLLEGRKAEADTVLSRGKSSASADGGEKRKVSFDSARQAKLWCLLGDLEPDHSLEHYMRAWQVSKNTSGRASRSLGGFHFARGDYPKTIEFLRHAVSINPLLSRSWFIMGCAYVRLEEWEGAREAFTRCISIDDEDGESWSNLATVHLRMAEDVAKEVTTSTEDETQKAIPFSNKMLAFRALKQGVKHGYENWRMWTNYMIVCMDVGELAEACHALSRIVEQRSTKVGAECVDEDVLEKLVAAVTQVPADLPEPAEGERLVLNPNEGHGLLKRVVDLFERVILPRVSSPRIYRAKARLLTWQSRWADAIKAHLDAYRCGVAGSMEKGETDPESWAEGLREVQDIVDVLRNFGPRVEGFGWLLQAKSIVRTYMGKTKENFEDEKGWERLTELLEDLKN